MLAPLAALGIAGLIAAGGVALSLRWSSELLAALAFIGAMAVPLVVLLDDELTVLGTSFVAVMLAASSAVVLRRDWRGLLIASVLVSVPQVVALVVAEEPTSASLVVVAAAFVGIYLATGVLRQLATSSPRLDSLAGALVLGAASLGGLSSFVLFDDVHSGLAFAALAAVYVALAVSFWRDETLELAAATAAIGTALAAVAAAELLGGPALVVAWAAEAAALAWLGRRIAETRFQLLALGYLGVSLAYTLIEEAPLYTLYQQSADFAAGIPALLAVAVGAVAYGLAAQSWPAARGRESMPHFLQEVIDDLHDQRPYLSAGALSLAGVLVLDAASLGVLELMAFDWGHVAVTGLWSAAALATLAVGLLRRIRLLEIGGLVLLAATIASFVGFTVTELEDVSGWAAIVLAVATAGAALLHGQLSKGVEVVPPFAVALSLLFAAFASFELLDADVHGYGLLTAAAAHGLVAVAVWRRRDLATCFWVAALLLGVGAAALQLDETWLVLALALGGALLAWLGRVTREPRLWVASASLIALAGVDALAELAAPSAFFDASGSPATGVPAVLLAAAAVAALLVSVRRFEPVDRFDVWIDERVEPLRELLAWVFAGLCLYSASLSILGLAEVLSNAGDTTEFQRGHTAVSSFWGLVAFGALILGLRRGSRALRLAGLGLFALALGKLFIYDLSTLSSITRALSFLAVGAVLLLAGFFYQRLTEVTETT